MYLRTVFAAPLLLAIALPAQNESPKPAGTPAVGAPQTQQPVKLQPVDQVPDKQEPTKQDPEKKDPVKENTPEQILEQLRAEKARLEREIAYARERVTNAKGLLSSKLSGHENTFRAIDAGKSATSLPMPQPVQRVYARIATPEEINSQPEGTMFVVGGRAISDSYFHSVLDYLRTAQSAGDDNMRGQRAAFDMIRIEGVASKFEENEGEVRLGQYISEVDSGKSLAEIAKTEGSVAGADENGRLEVTRNSQFGPFFEFKAFTTPAGQHSRPFRNLFGYVMLHVDSVEKGATPELDKVICHAVQVDYTTDQEALKQAQFAANSGQIEILVRNQAALDMLPAMYKPAAPQLPERMRLQNQLMAFEQQLAKLEAAGEGDSDQAKAVKQQCEALRAAIEKMPQPPLEPSDADTGVKTEPAPVKKDEGKKDEPKKPEGGR